MKRRHGLHREGPRVVDHQEGVLGHLDVVARHRDQLGGRRREAQHLHADGLVRVAQTV